MGLADLVTPVAAPYRDDRHLRRNDRAADRSRHLQPLFYYLNSLVVLAALFIISIAKPEVVCLCFTPRGAHHTCWQTERKTWAAQVSPEGRLRGGRHERRCNRARRAHLLRAFDAEPAVAVRVADAHKCLEARPLARARLLLHRHDLHHLVFQRRSQELLHNLIFLHREGEEVDLLHRLDLVLLHEAAELRAGNPFLLLFAATPATACAASVVVQHWCG